MLQLESYVTDKTITYGCSRSLNDPLIWEIRDGENFADQGNITLSLNNSYDGI